MGEVSTMTYIAKGYYDELFNEHAKTIKENNKLKRDNSKLKKDIKKMKEEIKALKIIRDTYRETFGTTK